MSIVSRSTDVKPHALGYRGYFNYTFDDGRKVRLGPFYSDINDFSSLQSVKEASANRQINKKDSDEAIDLGLTDAHRHATRKEVIKRYIKRAYQEDDPLTMYEMLLPVAQIIIDMGLTNAQLSAYLETSIERVQDFKAKWHHLNSNSATLMAYKAVRDGL